ncbi:hypothetical protein NPIL_695571 [Nephila pilipes]|uniref:Uncharacterized protein n=1 Tax=Nephila pilipes TaxID=299642 RepID=A0A8X6QSM1_NEPPI|nr:hypothetical protein NPIL_695571 [Nephila pilipes]
MLRDIKNGVSPKDLQVDSNQLHSRRSKPTLLSFIVVSDNNSCRRQLRKFAQRIHVTGFNVKFTCLQCRGQQMAIYYEEMESGFVFYGVKNELHVDKAAFSSA